MRPQRASLRRLSSSRVRRDVARVLWVADRLGNSQAILVCGIDQVGRGLDFRHDAGDGPGGALTPPAPSAHQPAPA